MIKNITIPSFDQRAIDVYELFLKKDGASNIAKPPTLHTLCNIIAKDNVNNVLEVGGGIGTLSFLMLQYFPNTKLEIFEDNAFCITALQTNLSEYNDRFTIHTDYNNFTLQRKEYDLIIVDGANVDMLRQLIANLDSVKIILIDGKRTNQRSILRKDLKEKFLFLWRITLIQPTHTKVVMSSVAHNLHTPH